MDAYYPRDGQGESVGAHPRSLSFGASCTHHFVRMRTGFKTVRKTSRTKTILIKNLKKAKTGFRCL